MLLLDASADVNTTNHQGLTPLHQAIIYGKRDAAELLLCYGASVHGGRRWKEEGGRKGEERWEGRSPLELASYVHICHPVVERCLGEE